jgi:hypothetical protein
MMLLLAALLFPVFASARSSAKRINCVSNFHQVQTSSLMYMSDYDDKFVLSTHAPGVAGNSSNDRTWVQMTLPYVRSLDVFFCPSDHTRARSDRAFEPNAIPGDPYGRFYSASKRSNLGFNWLYLSPVVMQNGRWMSVPRSVSFAADLSSTILFVDSVNEVVQGRPTGGGHHLISPPCRYVINSSRELSDSFAISNSEVTFYTPQSGWSLSRDGTGQWGNVWPWHQEKANVARLDGSIRSMRMTELYAGCSIGPDWSGSINDTTSYLWDLR